MSTGFRRDGKTDDRLLEAYRIALGQWRESVRLAAHVSGRPHLAIIETRTLCGLRPTRTGAPLGLELSLMLGGRLDLCGSCRKKALHMLDELYASTIT